jgi:hypothetical protein
MVAVLNAVVCCARASVHCVWFSQAEERQKLALRQGTSISLMLAVTNI